MDRRSPRAALLAAGAVLVLAVAGCAGDDPAPAAAAPDEAAALPTPGGAGGSVTGMPDSAGRADPSLPPAAVDAPADLPAPADDPLAPLSSPSSPEGAPADAGSVPSEAAGPTTAAEPATANPADDAGPGTAEALALIRAYYDAISAGQPERARVLWADRGEASGQDPAQFAAGFADTAALAVELLAPGRVEAAAGSRFIEVPVAVTATRRDGSVHRYVGAYSLRRSVGDGASDDQRAWRIAAADLREVQP